MEITRYLFDSRRLFIVLLLVALALYLINYNSFQVGGYQDDASYVVLAQSIATGHGYARINFPSPQPEIAWPAGYPLLLSPFLAISPFDFAPLKLFSIFLTILSILVLRKYLEFHVTPPYALLIVTLYAINWYIVSQATMVMSEPAYTLWTLLGLFIFGRFEKDNFSKWYHAPLLALVLVTVSLTRLIGVSLAIACGLMMLTRRKLKSAVILGLLYSLGMIPQIVIFRQGGGYLVPAEVAPNVNVWQNIGIVWPNLKIYLLEQLPVLIFGLFGPTTYSVADRFGVLWLVSLVKWGLLFSILLGILRTATRRIEAGHIYVFLYLAALSLTRSLGGPSFRYLLPLLPFAYWYFVEGIDWVASWIAGWFSRLRLVSIAMACVVVPVLMISGVRSINNARNPISESITDLTIGTTWIAINTEKEAVIMCRNPIQRYIYARRLTTDFPRAEDELTLLQEIESQNVSYILVGPEVQQSPTPKLDAFQADHVLPLMYNHPDRFQLVYNDEEEMVSVFRVIHTDQHSTRDEEVDKQ